MAGSRKSLIKPVAVFSLSIVIVCIACGSAYAYVDPGTGGLLYQIVFIIIALVGSYLGFLRNFIKRVFGQKGQQVPDEED